MGRKKPLVLALLACMLVEQLLESVVLRYNQGEGDSVPHSKLLALYGGKGLGGSLLAEDPLAHLDPQKVHVTIQGDLTSLFQFV